MAMRSLVYDWNTVGHPRPTPHVLLDDETLRDGLQSPSIQSPPIERRLEILRLMESLGIDCADIGFPGAGEQAARDVEQIAREIASARMRISPNCAARTVVADIQPIVEISQRVGFPIEVAAFIGSSPIRQFVEDWTIDDVERRTEAAVSFSVREGLPIFLVTEDTTRADPGSLRRIYGAALRAGARRLCVADTVGHATPEGARAVVRFVRSIVEECGVEAGIDWHGHDDRGLAIASSLAAIEAGATRIHATALGIGERVGNTPMELLLVNLVLLGYAERDLTRLQEYCAAVSDACGRPIPINYPIFGRDAFRTATGVHASAIIKALRKREPQLADAIYSSIPAHLVGREQEIEIGPMSGRSNVVYWLERRRLEVEDALVDRIFAAAKRASRVLREEEVWAIVRNEGTKGPRGQGAKG